MIHKYCKFILLSGIFIPGILSAQQNEFQWRIGFFNGVTHFHGDLSYKFIDPNFKSVDVLKHPEYFTNAISLEKRLSQGIGLGLIYTQGQFIANDRTMDRGGNLRTDNPNFGRSLNANTKIKDLSLYFSFYLDNGKILGNRSFVAPYFKVGAGYMNFNVYGDLFYGENEDQRYYYWDDNTVRDRPPGTAGANIIEQDGVFETQLNGLKTEGKDYRNNVFSFSGAFGLKFRLGSRFNLNIEMLASLPATDFLEDVSGKFLTEYESELQRYAANPADMEGPYRGKENDRSDMYTFTSISLHYNFGRKKRAYTVPAIAVGPLMAAPTGPEYAGAAYAMSADPTMWSENYRLRLSNDSLQYAVDSLRGRIALLTAPADSMLADSLRRLADSLYMRADSLYPALYAKDTLSVTRARYAAAMAYEPLSDTLSNQEKVDIYQMEKDSIQQEVEAVRAVGGLTPEQEERLEDVERQLEDYDDALRRIERSVDNDDDYKDLEEEIKRLRKQLNITTGVAAAAGVTAAVVDGDKKEKKEEESAIEEVRDSVPETMPDTLVHTGIDSLQADTRLQTQIDSLQNELDKERSRPGLQRKQSVYFAVNSASLSPPARRTIEDIAAIAKQYPDLKVRLEGYTDPSGNPDYNRDLSARRAGAVRDHLTKSGVPVARIVMDPQGVDNESSDPILGRRVDLILEE